MPPKVSDYTAAVVERAVSKAVAREVDKRLPKKRGRPAFHPTDADRLAVTRLVLAGYTREEIAECIGGGINVSTLAKHFPQELQVSRRMMLGQVVESLYRQAMDGDVRAAIWITKSQLGWSEKRQEADQDAERRSNSDDEIARRIVSILERARQERLARAGREGPETNLVALARPSD